MRDTDIDVLRGYCIASMIFGHFAVNSIPNKILHISPYFDGASGFVLLSGLILGRVVQGRIQKGGLKKTQTANLKRVLEIYLYHLLIVYSALLFKQISNLAELSQFDLKSSTEMLTETLLLIDAPKGGEVLRLYVMIMSLLSITIYFFSKNRWRTGIGASFGLYVLAYMQPGIFSFPGAPEGELYGTNWGMWQFLFVLAFAIGWHWKELLIPEAADRHPFLFIGALLAAIASSRYLYNSDIGPYLWSSWASKQQMGPLRIVYGFTILVGLYALLRLTKTQLRFITPIFSTVGQRSLDSYVIQGIAFSFITVFSSSWIRFDNLAIAVSIFLFCYFWANLKIKRIF